MTCEIQNKIPIQNFNFGVRWTNEKPDWKKKIQMLCEEQFDNLSVEGSVDDMFGKVVRGIYLAALYFN